MPASLEFVRALKALADPLRLRILAAVAEEELTVGEVAVREVVPVPVGVALPDPRPPGATVQHLVDPGRGQRLPLLGQPQERQVRVRVLSALAQVAVQGLGRGVGELHVPALVALTGHERPALVQGHIRQLEPGQLRQALPAGIVCVQNAYSLLNRGDEPLLDLCREHDIAWVPFFPLGSAGFPGVDSVTSHPDVIETASKLSVTPAQVGLAWLLAHAPNILLIPGTSNPDHLAENVATSEVYLNPEIMDTLDSIEAGR